MPPASPDTTLAWRSASSSEVLPWSTWPMTVTTGERVSVSVESSTISNSPSSTSLAATRLTVWPSSSAISWAVSASITSVILCIAPCFISSRMTSTARSDMRLASSWILMASGMTTSRVSFSFGSFDACPFSRWVRRRNEAIERSRTSSALSAVTSVRRPRCLAGAGLAVGFGAAAGRTAPPGPRRTWRGPSSSSLISAAMPGARAVGIAARAGVGVAALASASPKRFLASSSALRLASSSWRWRSSSALRRASAASRSACSRPSLLLRRLASSSARRRSSTSRTLASASALARAERSSSVSVRSTTPEPLRAAGGGEAGRGSGALAGAALTTAGSGAWVSVPATSPPTRRLPRFSTTTCLVRPWLKLCFTVPVSMRGLSVKVLLGTLRVFSPGVLVSTIQQSQSCCVVRIRSVALSKSLSAILLRILLGALFRTLFRIFGRVAVCPVVIRHPVSDQDMAARQERLVRRAREQRSIYHIGPAQCQIQLFRSPRRDNRKPARFTGNPGILPDQGVQFPDSIRRPVRGVDQGLNRALGLPLPEGFLALGKTRQYLASLGGHGQRLDRASHQEGLGIRDKRRRDTDIALETLAKMVTPDRLCNRLTRRRNPQPAPRKLALQIGDHLALGRHHKPDQLVDRADLAGDRAHPRRRGLCGPRSVVEVGVSQGQHGCDVAPNIRASSGRGTGVQLPGTWLSRLVCLCRGRLVGVDEIGFGDPAGNDARLHDHVLRIVARDFVGIENAGMLGRLAAFLALGPADQIVGGASRQILDGLDIVLAELHQHLRGHAGHPLQSIVHAELLSFVFELAFELFQILASPALQFVGGFVVETFDAGQFLDVDHRQFLHRGEAFRGQQLAHHFVDVQRFHEHPRGVFEIGLAAFGFFLFGQDVDVPAGQLRGEADILAAPSDRQRQLIIGVGDHDFDPLAILVDHDLGDLRGRQRIDDKGRDVRRPRDDVDLLALQFIDYRLHARAAHADAGADWIDRRIPRNHPDFRPGAGIAGNRLDLDDAVVDLRHFLREQFRHELRMGARQENLRSPGLAPHVENIGANAIAVAEPLARQHLVAAHDGLAAAEIDNDAAIFDALDDAVDDIADTVLEFLVLPVAPRRAPPLPAPP